MEMIKMKKPYRTKDLFESAFLYASGKRLASVENDGKKCYFIFDNFISCKELADCFWRKEALVNAKEFADAFRTLKDIIFNK